MSAGILAADGGPVTLVQPPTNNGYSPYTTVRHAVCPGWDEITVLDSRDGLLGGSGHTGSDSFADGGLIT